MWQDRAESKALPGSLLYMGENVAGKAGIVIKAKSCVICLHPNHTVDQCYDKDNQKRI